MWLSTFSTGERGSSRGINSDQSFASLKEFWLKQLKSILFYLYGLDAFVFVFVFLIETVPT